MDVPVICEQFCLKSKKWSVWWRNKVSAILVTAVTQCYSCYLRHYGRDWVRWNVQSRCNVSSETNLVNHWDWTISSTFSEDISNAFMWMKIVVFWLEKISKFISHGLVDNRSGTGPRYGLAPNKQQPIIWTNADPVHYCCNLNMRMVFQ